MCKDGKKQDCTPGQYSDGKGMYRQTVNSETMAS